MYFNFTQSSYMCVGGARSKGVCDHVGAGPRNKAMCDRCNRECVFKSVLLIDCVYARYHAHMHVPLAVAFVFQSVLINLLQFLSLQYHSQSDGADCEPEQYTYYSPGHYSIYGDEEEGPTILSWQDEQGEEEEEEVNSLCFLV